MVECLTCGGRYEPIQTDGLQYFHACPALAVHEIQARLDEGTLTLSRADAKRLQDAQDADAATPVDDDAPTRTDTVLASLRIERPNKRDENIVAGADRSRGKAQIKAEGAGVVDVPADEPSGLVSERVK
jgi:hypothetical protein